MSLAHQFGRRVRDLRTQAALTQAELAERCDVSPESISNIERGRHGPRLEMIGRLAVSLNVPVSALFEGLNANT